MYIQKLRVGFPIRAHTQAAGSILWQCMWEAANVSLFPSLPLSKESINISSGDNFFENIECEKKKRQVRTIEELNRSKQATRRMPIFFFRKKAKAGSRQPCDRAQGRTLFLYTLCHTCKRGPWLCSNGAVFTNAGSGADWTLGVQVADP